MTEDKNKRIFTIPNAISFTRILLIIPYVIVFLSGNYIPAACILIASGLSDMFDGMIARKFDQISDLGLILDPLADKLTLIAVVVTVSIKIPDIVPLAAVLFLKELLMMIGGFVFIRKNMKMPASKWYGKLATIIFYISATVLVYINAILKYNNKIISFILILITTASMIFAFIMYIKLFTDELHRQSSQKETAQAKGEN